METPEATERSQVGTQNEVLYQPPAPEPPLAEESFDQDHEEAVSPHSQQSSVMSRDDQQPSQTHISTSRGRDDLVIATQRPAELARNQRSGPRLDWFYAADRGNDGTSTGSERGGRSQSNIRESTSGAGYLGGSRSPEGSHGGLASGRVHVETGVRLRRFTPSSSTLNTFEAPASSEGGHTMRDERQIHGVRELLRYLEEYQQ